MNLLIFRDLLSETLPVTEGWVELKLPQSFLDSTSVFFSEGFVLVAIPSTKDAKALTCVGEFCSQSQVIDEVSLMAGSQKYWIIFWALHHNLFNETSENLQRWVIALFRSNQFVTATS